MDGIKSHLAWQEIEVDNLMEMEEKADSSIWEVFEYNFWKKLSTSDPLDPWDFIYLGKREYPNPVKKIKHNACVYVHACDVM